MRRKFNQVPLLTLLWLIAAVRTPAQEVSPEQTLAVSDIPVINLCVPSNATTPLKLWNLNIASALARVSFIPSIHTAHFTIKELPLESCPDVQKTACQSEKGAVSCNTQKIARLLFSEAYVASSRVVLRDSKMAHHGGKLDVFDGLILADAAFRDDGSVQSYVDRLVKQDQLSSSEFSAISDLARQLRAYDVTAGAVPPSPLVALAYELYEASTNYVMAFIFGHELSHAYGRCVATKPSAMEANGELTKIVSLQTNGDVLCPNPIYLDEIKADRCALRIIEEMDRAMVEWKTRAENPPEEQVTQLNLLSFSRRDAIDSLFYYLQVGLEPDSTQAAVLSSTITSSEIQYSPGYLYNGLRGIIFAATLRHQEFLHRDSVGICDNAARDLVHSLNMAVMICRLPRDKKGQWTEKIDQSGLIGPFSEFVPPGVVKSWQTHVWHDSGPDNSFSCSAHP